MVEGPAARGGGVLVSLPLVKPLKTLARPLGRLESGDGGASPGGKGIGNSSRRSESGWPNEASRRSMLAKKKVLGYS